MNNPRIAVASIVAPPAGIAAATALMGIMYGQARPHSLSEILTLNGGLFFMMFFGLPIGYLVEAIVGVPAYRWLVRSGRLRLAWVVVAAMFGGTVAFSSVWLVAFPSWSVTDVAQTILIGSIGGAVAGFVFWTAAFVRPRSQQNRVH